MLNTVKELYKTQDLAGIVLMAEAKMGELLKKIPDKYSLGSPGRTKTLPSGVTKKQSHYAQELSKNMDIIVEAKQWAIGDWLKDGKKHYGDGLYKEAEVILGQGYQYLAQQKNLAELFEIIDRSINLSWKHHYEVASIKQIEEIKGKLKLSKEQIK